MRGVRLASHRPYTSSVLAWPAVSLMRQNMFCALHEGYSSSDGGVNGQLWLFCTLLEGCASCARGASRALHVIVQSSSLVMPLPGMTDWLDGWLAERVLQALLQPGSLDGGRGGRKRITMGRLVPDGFPGKSSDRDFP